MSRVVKNGIWHLFADNVEVVEKATNIHVSLKLWSKALENIFHFRLYRMVKVFANVCTWCCRHDGFLGSGFENVHRFQGQNSYIYIICHSTGGVQMFGIVPNFFGTWDLCWVQRGSDVLAFWADDFPVIAALDFCCTLLASSLNDFWSNHGITSEAMKFWTQYLTSLKWYSLVGRATWLVQPYSAKIPNFVEQEFLDCMSTRLFCRHMTERGLAL